MQKIPFFKYQGTGNDFVLIDQREHRYVNETDTDLVAKLCDRRFGIGADGLILLQLIDGYDFEMVYFNADGRPSSMCGNGGRCIVAFAHFLGLVAGDCRFLAVDGPHEASIADGQVALKMGDVSEIAEHGGGFVLDTGSPHYVALAEQAEDVDRADFVQWGRSVRQSEAFAEEGINVNLVARVGEGLRMRTYERGVEDETLSCGTGATASALVAHEAWGLGSPIRIRVEGGEVEVAFSRGSNGYGDIWLSGPAEQVYSGEIIV